MEESEFKENTAPPPPHEQPLVRAGPRFSITHPIHSFGGEECGVKFLDGAGRTESSMYAHALLQNGCTVIDHVAGGQFGSSGEPEDAARIAARAEERRAAGK